MLVYFTHTGTAISIVPARGTHNPITDIWVYQKAAYLHTAHEAHSKPPR